MPRINFGESRRVRHRSALLLPTLLFFLALLGGPPALAQSPGQGPPNPGRPLKRADLYRMLDMQVSSVDILIELALRKVDEAIDADTLRQLAEKGADRLLLNNVSAHYAPIQGALRDLHVFRQEERHQRVIELADQLLENAPRLFPALFARADAHLKLKNAALAQRDLRQLLEYSPDSSLVQLLLAKALEAEGRDDEAIELLSAILQRNASSALQARGECYYTRGKLLTKRGLHRQAAEDFQRALVYLPLSYPVLDAAATLLARTSDAAVRSPAAAREFATVLQLAAGDDGRRAQAQIRLAEAAAAEGDFPLAERHLNLTEAFAPPADVVSQVARLREEISAKALTFWPATRGEVLTGGDAASAIRSQLTSHAPMAGEAEFPPFLLMSRPLTRREWAENMGLPRPLDGDEPMDGVSWTDAQTLIEKLNQSPAAQGLRFRLPRHEELQRALAQEPAATTESTPEQRAAAAEWCDDRYTPDYSPPGQPAQDSPFRRIFASAESVSSELAFAPENARWRGLRLRLAAASSDAEAPTSGERQHLRQAGLTRSIDLAARATEWDPMMSSAAARISLTQLLLLESAVRVKEQDWDAALAAARRLVSVNEVADPRRADFARCLLVLFASRRAQEKGEKAESLQEFLETVDSVRGKQGFGYWFAEFARAALLRAQGDFEQAATSAQRALDLAPGPQKPQCRALLDLVERRDASAAVEAPSLRATLEEGLLPASPGP